MKALVDIGFALVGLFFALLWTLILLALFVLLAIATVAVLNLVVESTRRWRAQPQARFS